jgi:acylphosphatase
LRLEWRYCSDMTSAASLVARRYLVSGKVQGVFFRASTARAAAEHGLRGYAINLPDGRVEVVAAGSPQALVALREWLQRGPPQARVAAVEESPADVDPASLPARFRTG